MIGRFTLFFSKQPTVRFVVMIKTLKFYRLYRLSLHLHKEPCLHALLPKALALVPNRRTPLWLFVPNGEKFASCIIPSSL